MKPNFYHKELANGGWERLDFSSQMANVGSEIERAVKWKEKGKERYSREAFFRALELLDFTIADNKKNPGKLRELCRTREMLVDYFFADNKYQSSAKIWQNYFRAFTWKAGLSVRK